MLHGWPPEALAMPGRAREARGSELTGVSGGAVAQKRLIDRPQAQWVLELPEDRLASAIVERHAIWRLVLRNSLSRSLSK